LAALNDTDKYVRHNAVVALLVITPDAANKAGADAAMLPALLQMLRDSEPALRRSAAEGLAKLGKVAQPAVPALLAVLDDPDPATRKLAANALKAIDIEAAAKAGVR
jgi:HEAT repeat protein